MKRHNAQETFTQRTSVIEMEIALQENEIGPVKPMVGKRQTLNIH